MSVLQCGVRNPGCRSQAKYVCHHCGKPVCINCDREFEDRQFARPSWRKRHPKAHHCPGCSHGHPKAKFAIKQVRQKIGRYLRKFYF